MQRPGGLQGISSILVFFPPSPGLMGALCPPLHPSSLLWWWGAELSLRHLLALWLSWRLEPPVGEGLPAPTPKSHSLPLSLFSHPSLGWGWVLGGGDKLQEEEWRLDFEKHFPTVRPDQGHGIPEMDTPGQAVEVCK